MITEVACVAAGAIAGALLRFGVTHVSSEISHHHGFPYGTLMVNTIGSLVVGYVLSWTANHTSDHFRLLIATGFCGALTTFSAFAFETAQYWHDGDYLLFAANIFLNNTLSLIAVLVGVAAHNRVVALVSAFQRT